MKPQDLRVLVVGLGGLGCPAALALASAGVRRFTFVDPDRVDPTNLHRQLLHRTPDVGRWKVESAAERMRAIFPGVEIEALPGQLDAANAAALLLAHDRAIDGTDGQATKLLLSDQAAQTGATLIHGGVLRFQGLALRIRPGGPCLRCVFEGAEGAAAGAPPADLPTCAQAGVLGSMAGVVGALQALLALGPAGEGDVEDLHVLDGARLSQRRTRVQRAADCAAHRPPSRARLDIRDEVCPMTYVRVKLTLDGLAEGDELEVVLKGDEAARNVPRSAREEGHQVMSMTGLEGGLRQLLLKKQTRSHRWR